MASLVKKIRVKLRGTQGETLTEVLVAILVSGLAILLLAMAIASAASTNMKSRSAFDAYYSNNNDIVAFNGSSGGDATVKLSMAITESSGDSVPVKYKDVTEGSVVVVAYEAP